MEKPPIAIVAAFLALAATIISLSFVISKKPNTVPLASNVQLIVPQITQAPGGNWNNPWGNACEEASASMVMAFYENIPLSQQEANAQMTKMFAWENTHLKKNEDTNAEETKKMIEANTSFRTSIQRNPTLEKIKKELHAKRPVIALVNQFSFYNERPTGIKEASFHVFVITGYNDTTKTFTVNDPARDAKLYPYERLMNALHDLGAGGEADGIPTVLFTKP